MCSSGLKMLTQSFKVFHSKNYILGQALTLQHCRKTQKRILFWFCTTDNNNYHAYLISETLNLNRSLFSYWINCQGNSFTAALQLRTKTIVLENAVSLLPLGQIFVGKDYRGSSVGAGMWWMFTNNKIGEDMHITRDSAADSGLVYRTGLIVNSSLISFPTTMTL